MSCSPFRPPLAAPGTRHKVLTAASCYDASIVVSACRHELIASLRVGRGYGPAVPGRFQALVGA